MLSPRLNQKAVQVAQAECRAAKAKNKLPQPFLFV
jgi:hypothetical protein